MMPIFIARSYPPSIGGMERFSYHLAAELRHLGACFTIVNHRGRRALPLFLPYSVMVAILAARKGSGDLIHLSDALLAPAGLLLKKATGLPVSCTIHGLDLTFDNRAYQALLGGTLPELDRLIAVSESTRDICIQRWPQLRDRVVVVPNGVNAPTQDRPQRTALPLGFESAVQEKRVVLTVGRLVERKGVAWFIQNVMPLLPESVMYAIAGDGPEREVVQRAIRRLRMESRVLLLGHVTDSTLESLYERADVFAMPNIIIENDVEGFGLVGLEAAIRGLPVVASDSQGIPEAIHNGANGFLVAPGDAPAFAEKVQDVLALSPRRRRNLSARSREYTRGTFSWRNTAQGYWREFESLAGVGSTTTRAGGSAISTAA